MSTTYVVSGGTGELPAALAGRLRADRVVLLSDDTPDHGFVHGDGSRCELADIGASLVSWIHLLPDASCGTRGIPLGEAPAGALAAGGLADRYLPGAAGATLTMAVPAWGTVAREFEAGVELAAAAARAHMQTTLEQWAANGRRVNIVRYVPPGDVSSECFRDAETLVARTPMHRLATTGELADAIDFLASTAAAYITGGVLDLDGGWSAYSWFYPARDL